MAIRQESTIFFDHENLSLNACQLRQLHVLLAELGRPPTPPHFIARATWNWNSPYWFKLGGAISELGYFLLTCPPTPDGVDTILDNLLRFIRPTGKTIVLVTQDQAFETIARDLRTNGETVWCIGRTKTSTSRKLQRACSTSIFLSDFAPDIGVVQQVDAYAAAV